MSIAQPLSFSIVIPCYNYAHLVERAVHSAISQSGDDFEVIVINDGSTDDSRPVLQRCCDRFGARLRVIDQANAGLSAVRNRGAQEARGDYLIYLDADDELLPDALAQLRVALADGSRPAMLIGGHLSIHANGREKLHEQPALAASRASNFLRYLRKEMAISNGGVAMRRDVVLVTPYDISLRHGEDIPVFALILATHDCRAINVPLVKIYKHDDSMRHNVATAQNAKLRLPAVLFDNPALPSSLQRFRREFFARSALSLFRSCYRAGEYADAVRVWRLALQSSPQLALQPKILIKILVAQWLALTARRSSVGSA